jgi:5-methylcytosine-specific restriction endonuclease McrA
MGKKLPHTPSSQIRSALRKLFLRSRERSSAIKRDGYTCQRCRAKQSRAQGRMVFVEVHHKAGVQNWEKLIEAVREYLLCDPSHLETLCKDCHDGEHDGEELDPLA